MEDERFRGERCQKGNRDIRRELPSDEAEGGLFLLHCLEGCSVYFTHVPLIRNTYENCFIPRIFDINNRSSCLFLLCDAKGERLCMFNADMGGTF